MWFTKFYCNFVLVMFVLMSFFVHYYFRVVKIYIDYVYIFHNRFSYPDKKYQNYINTITP